MLANSVQQFRSFLGYIEDQTITPFSNLHIAPIIRGTPPLAGLSRAVVPKIFHARLTV